MNSKKVIAALLGILAVVYAAILMMNRASDVTSLPTLSPRSGVAGGSSEYLNAQKSAEYLREEIHKHPAIVKNYIGLAQLFLQEGRITGNNAEYIPKAEYLLSEVLKRDPENTEATITQATIAATLHHFADAKSLAEKAISRNPHSAFYYGVLTDALVELGRYDEAVQACDKMLSLRPDLRSYARASYLRELHGHTDAAIVAMKMAADAGVNGQENRAWVLYNLGMLYFNSGKLDTAEYIFKGILDERPNYSHALSGLARVKASEKDFPAAIQLYQQAIAALPEPAFHESLGEVYASMGDMNLAQKQYDLAEELYEKEKQSGEDNAMEMARFLADHDRRSADALTIARGAVERRPSISAYETLALALYKNGLYPEASDAIQKAMKLGTRDASMFYLAGAIASKLGNRTQAAAYLDKALSINRNFSLINSREAERMLEVSKSIGQLISQ